MTLRLLRTDDLVFSERIAGIRTNSPTQLKVQNNVRAATRSYLQEHLPTTAPLPELREITELQVKHKDMFCYYF